MVGAAVNCTSVVPSRSFLTHKCDTDEKVILFLKKENLLRECGWGRTLPAGDGGSGEEIKTKGDSVQAAS